MGEKKKLIKPKGKGKTSAKPRADEAPGLLYDLA